MILCETDLLIIRVFVSYEEGGSGKSLPVRMLHLDGLHPPDINIYHPTASRVLFRDTCMWVFPSTDTVFSQERRSRNLSSTGNPLKSIACYFFLFLCTYQRCSVKDHRSDHLKLQYYSLCKIIPIGQKVCQKALLMA